MPEKLTLAVYLQRRGAVKALTRIEAEVFGVPYPLLKGWATRHGATEITGEMLDDLQKKIGSARSSTAQKARRGLNGATGVALVSATSADKPVGPTKASAAFPGFALQPARPRRFRKTALSA